MVLDISCGRTRYDGGIVPNVTKKSEKSPEAGDFPIVSHGLLGGRSGVEDGIEDSRIFRIGRTKNIFDDRHDGFELGDEFRLVRGFRFFDLRADNGFRSFVERVFLVVRNGAEFGFERLSEAG